MFSFRRINSPAFYLHLYFTTIWSLRRALQAPGGMIVVGASASYMEATADKDAAFYDFFQVAVLDKLKENELLV